MMPGIFWYYLLISIKITHYFSKSHWMCKVHVCHTKVFSSSGPMKHMSFCHHFAFVVIIVLWQGCHCRHRCISSIQKLTHYFSKSHWVCKVDICHTKVFSSSGPMKHMSFCHHFAFIVIIVLWQGCHCRHRCISSIQKLTHYFSKSHWVCKVDICHTKVFSSSGPMKHMSFLWQGGGGIVVKDLHLLLSI